MLERYFSDQRDSLFSEAKVVSPYQNDQKIKNDLQTSPSKTSLDKSVECQICFLVIPVSKMTGLECQHTFCTDCWRDYLSGKINDEVSRFHEKNLCEHDSQKTESKNYFSHIFHLFLGSKPKY